MKAEVRGAVRTLEHLAGKWRAPILTELLSGRKRFSQLQDELGDVSGKVLAENLRQLEAEGLVARVVYAGQPPRTEYALTEAGYGFRPVLAALTDWDRRFGDRR